MIAVLWLQWLFSVLCARAHTAINVQTKQNESNGLIHWSLPRSVNHSCACVVVNLNWHSKVDHWCPFAVFLLLLLRIFRKEIISKNAIAFWFYNSALSFAQEIVCVKCLPETEKCLFANLSHVFADSSFYSPDASNKPDDDDDDDDGGNGDRRLNRVSVFLYWATRILKSHYESPSICTSPVFIFKSNDEIFERSDARAQVFAFLQSLLLLLLLFSYYYWCCCFFINVGCYFCFTFEINIKIVLWRPFVYWKRYSREHVTLALPDWIGNTKGKTTDSMQNQIVYWLLFHEMSNSMKISRTLNNWIVSVPTGDCVWVIFPPAKSTRQINKQTKNGIPKHLLVQPYSSSEPSTRKQLTRNTRCWRCMFQHFFLFDFVVCVCALARPVDQ